MRVELVSQLLVAISFVNVSCSCNQPTIGVFLEACDGELQNVEIRDRLAARKERGLNIPVEAKGTHWCLVTASHECQVGKPLEVGRVLEHESNFDAKNGLFNVGKYEIRFP